MRLSGAKEDMNAVTAVLSGQELIDCTAIQDVCGLLGRYLSVTRVTY